MGESDKEILVEPQSSCFSRNDFMQDDFQVDKFVAECKKIVPLNVFKKELDDYLRLLKNALIELINQDYADFVNLSTNLVGMDKAINNLTIPLGQLREEILSIQNDLDSTIKSVENKLKQRAELREKKVFTQNLLNITHCMEKIERVFKSGDGEKETDKESSEQAGHLIERVASDFNQLQFYVTQCQGHPLVEKIRSRISGITSTLQKNLEASFQEGLKLGDTKTLTQCLRTYAIIDKISYAENLFRTFAVKPYMKIITEQALQSNSKGLQGLYENVLDFIPNYCSKLIDVTSGKTLDPSVEVSGNITQSIKGYNFIVNSVWPEIASAVQNNLTSIFAPGDPDAFHKKYTITMNFVQEFEKQCRSQENIKQLRNHPSYGALISRWSLPVYFQIRFQEIAGELETSMLTQCTVNEDEAPLHVNVTRQFWSCLERCWHKNIFLSALCHRFWKLSLQLIARLSKWLAGLKLQETVPVKSKVSSGLPNAGQDAETTEGQGESDGSHVTVSQLVYIIADVFHILKQIPELWKDIISPKLPDITPQEQDNLKDILINKRCSDLQQTLPQLSSLIVDHVSTLSANCLDGAKNIPRLYRRTNREAPLKPSAYITNLIDPIRALKVNHGKNASQEQLLEWSVAISESVSDKFYNVTSDVLTSIKRTEDSLLRLKRIKKSDNPSTNPATTEKGKMSDDDKIRMQFALDAEEFGKQISSLGIPVDKVSSYKKLVAFVENARSSSPSNSSS
ncbi:conserved oligomeric Golgi complex subunit 2-like isoform X2 [Dendronephthya gigantea]|nr:conserved oligomeric Golgi complex subunit 2-like isoform X2 [Dendronephthya gigantea]